jgi:hypothetical protein
MDRVNYLGFYNHSSARFFVFPPFREVCTPRFTVFAAATITEDDHNEAGSDHAYV